MLRDFIGRGPIRWSGGDFDGHAVLRRDLAVVGDGLRRFPDGRV
jgi:hypothetical protein